jgi:hypothetical protein
MKQETKTYQAWIRKQGRIGWEFLEHTCNSKKEFIQYWKEKNATVNLPIVVKGEPKSNPIILGNPIELSNNRKG